MHIAGSHNAFRSDGFGHVAHKFGDWALVVVSVAAEVVGDEQIYVGLEAFPGCCILGCSVE